MSVKTMSNITPESGDHYEIWMKPNNHIWEHPTSLSFLRLLSLFRLWNHGLQEGMHGRSGGLNKDGPIGS